MKILSQRSVVTLAAWLMVASAAQVFAQGVPDAFGSGGGGRGGAVFGGNTMAFGHVGSESVAPVPPFFANEGVREQLKLDEENYQVLMESYNRNRDQYLRDLAKLDTKLTSEERERRNNQLYSRYSNEFYKSRDQVLDQPELLERYQQLHRQHRFYAAFSEPLLQERLNLTAEQIQKFHRYYVESRQDMETFRRTYLVDRVGTDKLFFQWQNEARNRISSSLTPAQQLMWRDLIGNTYEFNLSDYFPVSTNQPVSPPAPRDVVK